MCLLFRKLRFLPWNDHLWNSQGDDHVRSFDWTWNQLCVYIYMYIYIYIVLCGLNNIFHSSVSMGISETAWSIPLLRRWWNNMKKNTGQLWEVWCISCGYRVRGALEIVAFRWWFLPEETDCHIFTRASYCKLASFTHKSQDMVDITSQGPKQVGPRKGHE